MTTGVAWTSVPPAWMTCGGGGSKSSAGLYLASAQTQQSVSRCTEKSQSTVRAGTWGARTVAAVLGGGLRPPARRANVRARTLDEMQSVYKVALQVCFVVW